MERRMSLLRQKGSDLSDSLVEDSPRGVSPATIGRENYSRGLKRFVPNTNFLVHPARGLAIFSNFYFDF